MWKREIFLYILIGCFICVQSFMEDQDDLFFHDPPGFFQEILPFPFERDLAFPPHDSFFSSWRIPDFPKFPEMPPMMIPNVQVYCDDSRLTLLVDKQFHGVTLTGDELQLGDGCFSNKELPNQFVFSYSFGQCGTAHGMHNGFEVFSNSLYLNLRKPLFSWWQPPYTVQISCMPKRSEENLTVPTELPVTGRSFSLKAMNSSSTNIYKRGQVINFQASARTRPDEQLFIQSCFVSASPEPHTRPRHAVIMNKGCTAPLGSPHAVIQFINTRTTDVVNFALNTTYLISEMYIHCSVVISNQGSTSGSKSCNYNVVESRWEELSGNAKVCSCCSSRCKGLSVKRFPEDAKSIVSAGPFIIVDKGVVGPAPSEPSSDLFTLSMQSDAAAPEDVIVSGASLSGKTRKLQWLSPPQGVVMVSQNPVTRLTLWLPGQEEDTGHGEDVASHLSADLEPSKFVSNYLPTSDQESEPSTLNEIRHPSPPEPGYEAPLWDLKFIKLVNRWPIPSLLDKVAAEQPLGGCFRGSEMPGAEVDSLLPVELDNDLDQMSDEADAVLDKVDANDAQPVIRSKLQFSKSVDGSKSLSYEEEMVKQDGGKVRRSGEGGTQGGKEAGRRGLLSAFLNFLRKLDQAE